METPELAMEGIELALRGAVGEPAFTDAMENALIEAHTVSAQGRSSKSRQRRHSTAEDVPSEPKCDEGALRSRMERLNAKARTLERDLERHETQSEVLVAVAEVATRLVDQRQEARGAQWAAYRVENIGLLTRRIDENEERAGVLRDELQTLEQAITTDRTIRDDNQALMIEAKEHAIMPSAPAAPLGSSCTEMSPMAPAVEPFFDLPRTHCHNDWFS